MRPYEACRDKNPPGDQAVRRESHLHGIANQRQTAAGNPERVVSPNNDGDPIGIGGDRSKLERLPAGEPAETSWNGTANLMDDADKPKLANLPRRSIRFGASRARFGASAPSVINP